MSQHDYVIDNQAAPAFRSDLNGALAAIATTNSGTSAPSTPYANQLWVDTANNQLKIRNEDNDAWIVVADLDQTGDKSAPPDASVTFAKLAGAAVVTSSETIASNNNDTTIPTSAAVKAYADSVGYTQPTTLGDVGTYVFAVQVSGTAATSGGTTSGSNLRYTHVNNTTGSGAPSGTWRLMGWIDGTGLNGRSLWLRIS